MVLTSSFDYDLPAQAIAQRPAPTRDAARLLVVNGGGDIAHAVVADLPTLLAPGDLLVVNTTRVIPARLRLRKPTGGSAEVLLVAPLRDSDGRPDVHSRDWQALVRPSRRLPPGVRLVPQAAIEPTSVAHDFVVEVGEVVDGGLRLVRLHGSADPWDMLGAVGEVPLPPYITAAESGNTDRYQTVFADAPSSVAAPTAGLHLTDEVLARLSASGVNRAVVELDIGPGTFTPVTATNIEDHVMHAERYRVPDETVEAIESTRERGGAVVAIGTTVVRSLESWAATGQQRGDTSLFITPAYPFAVVDRLFTNFHQPRSTLLVLLEAFMGPQWRDVYATALDSGYRFLSFGDAMLVNRAAPEVAS